VAGSIQALLDDLVDFNRTRLGLGVKVVPCDIDLAAAASDEVEQLRGAHPDRRIELTATGNTRAYCDRMRVQQLLRNLISNAIQYSYRDTLVRVTLRGEETDIRIDVTNSGPGIDPSALKRLFNPLEQGMAQRARGDARGGLGLGLFIVQEIAAAHGGDVKVRSDGEETTLAVRLPRGSAGLR
jgi:signal transduction histidine kinase